MREQARQTDILAAVPLFPLPNVVLFPRAILPLHIFEERYKAMMAETLRSHQQIAMAHLRPGWELEYYAQAPIDPVVCIGHIVNHERLPDGRYNLLLMGKSRGRIVREERVYCPVGGFYRLAQIQLLDENPVLEIDVDEARRRLVSLFEQPSCQALPQADQFRRLLGGPMPTADIADLLAFNLLDDVELKQSLLAQADVRQRIWRVVDEITALAPSWRNGHDDFLMN